MGTKKFLRQRSPLYATIEEAEDGLVGITAQDCCAFAYIEPNLSGGYHVLSFNDVGDIDTLVPSSGQRVVRVLEGAL